MDIVHSCLDDTAVGRCAFHIKGPVYKIFHSFLSLMVRCLRKSLGVVQFRKSIGAGLSARKVDKCPDDTGVGIRGWDIIEAYHTCLHNWT